MYYLNLFFLKNTNGMFYYALDFYNELEIKPSIVLLNAKSYELMKNSFSDSSKVVKCNYIIFLFYIIKSLVNKFYIFTPTCHPLPFINRQFSVLHDLFPFQGLLGFFKKCLFILSIKSSKSKLIYINKSICQRFYNTLKIDDQRLIYLPNKFPAPHLMPDKEIFISNRIKIGLFGTDSHKKNYDKLFSKILDMNLTELFIIKIYGQNNPYYLGLVDKFKRLSIGLYDSNKIKMTDFISDLDVVISIADSEGFGRPIACCIASGIPCFLIDCDVFREFYYPKAFFYNSTELILENLVTYSNKIRQIRPSIPSENSINGFKAGIFSINNLIIF